jgi:predicted dehydrogenase
MGICIGLVGLGSFGSAFAPLFKAHPLVDRIALCDREPERMRRFATDPYFRDKFRSEDAYASLEEICDADLDALVIMTQPWLHAPQCIQAMKAGKHVYSAVPVISLPDGNEILDWCDRLVDTCKRTGMTYMLGETTCFRPQAMFCRRKAAEGAFGDFVYAEGEYCHDVDHTCNLREVAQRRRSSASGEEWRERERHYRERGAQDGPMHYPTHSTSGPVWVMRTHAEKVTAYGFGNKTGDPFFAGDAFSNEVALFRMNNGATVRIAELRETPGRLGDESETFRILGTSGAFSENRWFEVRRPAPEDIDPARLPRSEVRELAAEEMFDRLPGPVEEAFKRAMNREADEGELREKDFTPRGHGGSHPYLVHEFVDAVASDRQPGIHVWEAVRFMAMGVAAHQSALKDGETLAVPDWGDAP